MQPCRFALLALLSLVLPPLAAPASSQGIAVAPVSIELGPQQRTAVITVVNRNPTPITVQIRPFAWSTAANADELAPTDQLVASPPFAELAPEQSQTIRLVLRQGAAAREATYRLLIDELPPPQARGVIRVALRFSVPVFAAAADGGAADLAYSIAPGPDGPVLAVRNRGNRHARLLSAELRPMAGAPVALGAARGAYVLPGAERFFPIAEGGRLRTARSVTLHAQSDSGPVDTAVPVLGAP